jgi:hypothetical protein
MFDWNSIDPAPAILSGVAGNCALSADGKETPRAMRIVEIRAVENMGLKMKASPEKKGKDVVL